MRRSMLVPATVLALAGFLTACGSDRISDEDRDRAAAAAVEAAGGGTATSVDRADDDDLYEYEVEVQREGGGGDVEVRLDEDFKVVGDVPSAAPSDDADDAAPSASPSSAPTSAAPSASGDDRPLEGEVLRRASAAAIEAAGGDGRVTDADYSDDQSHAYEVEVRLPNGEDVDVDLAEDYSVVKVDR